MLKALECPTSPEWSDALNKTPVRPGRHTSPAPKVSTMLRLDLDLVTHFRACGPGWQTRIDATFRKAAGLQDR
ncbi:BrnA antitoxin family protein [Palleronia rufa]|uniref:BrnA antitoxin family protein n=1 Tax=Palleronia rufa TaxID=1530186 RepID=UPI001F1DF558|nr:BrnA antitoxin family protein [Palleronia rufa]